MDILTTLLQLLGGCAGGACPGQAAGAAAGAAGGLPGLTALLCKLFGLGC